MVETRNLEQYALIHQSKKYGRTDSRVRSIVLRPIAQAGAASILDYGAGQSTYIRDLKMFGLSVRHRYDPAIPSISIIPAPHYDVVICTDVLEHLDENEIEQVLNHVATLTRKAVFCADATEAATILPNGENAHATVQPAEWWLATVAKVFPDAQLISSDEQRAVIATWKPSQMEKLVGELKYLPAVVMNWPALKSKKRKSSEGRTARV